MTELSPAAQAVLKAGGVDQGWPIHRKAIAAALEAVVDQVVPDDGVASSIERIVENRIHHKLLAIAAELRGTNPTNQES